MRGSTRLSAIGNFCRACWTSRLLSGGFMTSSKISLYALALVVFYWVSLFGIHLPDLAQSVLFVIMLLLGLVMMMAGWWNWINCRNTEDVPYWRKGAGLVGVASNTLLAIPLAPLLCRMHYPFPRVAVFGFSSADMNRIVTSGLVLSLSALFAGMFAPPRCRFAILIGGVTIGSVLLSVPFGFV
jgi:hypothetical protein